jgi:hypothetical protein
MNEEFMRQKLYEEQINNSRSQTASNYAGYSTNLGFQEQRQNLIEYELDFTQEMIDIERLLRGDKYKTDGQGNSEWVRNENPDEMFLNELGVNDILRELKLLVNKGKILSNYNSEEITTRVRLIMYEMRAKIYNNYERYGMDNEYKINNYSMIVLTLGSIIEDAYRRALNGETHRGLAEQRLVTQSDTMGGNQGQNFNFNLGQQQKSKKWYAPWTWGR